MRPGARGHDGRDFDWIIRVLLKLLLITIALAGPDDRRAAEEHLARGIEAANANRVEDAIEEFEQGYAKYPSPALLFNLGLVYQAAKRNTDALVSYQKFIAAAEGLVAKDQDLVAPLEIARNRVAALRAELAPVTPPPPPQKLPAAAPSPVAPAPVPPHLDLAGKEPVPRPSYLKWWLIGAGAVAVGAAATWFLVSRDRCAPKYDVGCI